MKIRVSNGRGEMLIESKWETDFPANLDQINKDVAVIFEQNPHITTVAIGFEGGCTVYSHWEAADESDASESDKDES